jgi:long-chain acyl-CoA synthetase
VTADRGFLDVIERNLVHEPRRTAILEIHGREPALYDGGALLELRDRARAFLRGVGVKPGDRVALLAGNSARWVAADLAILAEGAIVVPLYDRQEPAELAVMLRSAEPVALLVAGDALAERIAAAWPEHGRIATFDEVFLTAPVVDAPPYATAPEDPVAIIFTSGTSGEPKGVVLDRANIDFMIPRTIARLGKVVGPREGDDRVFHFLPFCFAASRMMLWTQLSRPNPLMISTDLANLVQEMGTARANYFLTVPAVLERIRGGVTQKVVERGAAAAWLFDAGFAAFKRTRSGSASLRDRAVLAISRRAVYRAIRQQVGPALEFLISGSAPLAEDTQQWFQLLGIPVYQAYGLTETTGIVSLDEPERTTAGRVGFPLDGIEVATSDAGELLVRGPNLFRGYWRKPEATAEVVRDGWFHTGDQVEIEAGSLKIVGRIKNLIIPESGHNIAPEPLEEKFLGYCRTAQQCLVVGHGKAHLTIIVTGQPPAADVEEAIERLNGEVPHYRKIRRFHLAREPFTPENGLLTANQKLRRAAIERHYAAEIEAMYRG